MAKLFLEKDESFTALNANLTIFGGSGYETVSVAGYGIQVDQNVEQLNFSSASFKYTFLQAGNTLKVFDSSNQLAVSIPVQQDGTLLNFAGEELNLTLSTTAVMTIGDVTIPSDNPVVISVAPPDTTAPNAPIISLYNDAGTSQTDKITNDARLLVQAEEKAVVEYSVDHGETWYQANYYWGGMPSLEAPTFMIDKLELFKPGENNVKVKQTDLAGNVSEISTFEFTLDRQLPVAPTVRLLDSAGNSISATNNPNAALNITGVEPGAKLQYWYSGDDGWGNTIWNFHDSPPVFVEGYNHFSVTQMDVAGNMPNSWGGFGFTLDTIKPSAPVVSLFNDAGLSQTDKITNDARLAIQAEPNAKVEYSVDNGTTWLSADIYYNFPAPPYPTPIPHPGPVEPGLPPGGGSEPIPQPASPPQIFFLTTEIETSPPVPTTVPASPAFIINNLNAFDNGLNMVKVRQTDAAGNISEISNFEFTLDKTAPTTPTLTLNSDLSVTVAGIDENTMVEYLSYVNGSWVKSDTLPEFVEGTNQLQVLQTDLAGNTAMGSLYFVKDTTPPAAPKVELAYDRGISATDKITNDPTLKISSDEYIYRLKYSVNSTDGVNGDWTTTNNGNYIYAQNSNQYTEGLNKVYVKQVDQAGNESAATAFEFTLDRTAPTPATITLTNPIKGLNSWTNFTQDGLLTISGVEEGARIQYQHLVNGSWGEWSDQTPEPVVGNNRLVISQTDVAGNSNSSYIEFNYLPTLHTPTNKQEPWTLVSTGYSYDYYNGSYKLEVSDGTTVGTQSILSSNNGYSGLQLNSDKTKAFFSQYDNNLGKYNLTATDGTISGTSVIQNDAGYVDYHNALKLNNGKMAFSLGEKGLLVSDGTQAGTILSNVEIMPKLSSMIKDEAHGNYWFVANSVPYGNELGLLKINANGTATSSIVKDIVAGSGSGLGGYYYDSSIDGAILDSGKLVFSAGNYNEKLLWSSDGTQNGTTQIDGAVYPSDFIGLGDKAFLNSGGRITFTDGTVSGTTYATVPEGNALGDIKQFVPDAKTIYFTAERILQNEVAYAVYQINDNVVTVISTVPRQAQFLTATPNKVFFRDSNTATGEELWVADKSTNTFSLVKDILPGSGSALAGVSDVLTIGDKILFSAYINASKKGFFISDGTESGTIKLTDNAPTDKWLLGNKLIFSDATGVHSVDTSAATPTVSDLNTATSVGFQHDLDQVFFKAANGDFYVTTGASALKLASNVTKFNVLEENAIYFLVQDTVSGNTFQSLWYSNGTAEGTHFVSYVDNGFNLDGAVVIQTVGYPQV